MRDIGVTQAMYTRVFMAALLLTASLATALVYGWGGVLAEQGTLMVGTVVALTAYLNRLYGPLTALSNVQVDVMTALVSFDRVFEVLDLPPMIDEKPDAVAIPRGPALIEFDHVDFGYPSAEEVSLASLESVAVLEQHRVAARCSSTCRSGPSPASSWPWWGRRERGRRPSAISCRGSTTCAAGRCASTASTSATPRLRVDRGRSSAWSPRTPTSSTRPSGRNLRYAKPDATDDELIEALRAAQILPLVESLPDGLDTLVGDRGYRLSGGEKQRIAIARLLLKAPDIVVLDEATAHLDSESEVAVQQALKTALAGRTSLVIAHRLSTVREADLILVVDEGRIVERGRHDELLAAGGLYAELYTHAVRAPGRRRPDAVTDLAPAPGAPDLRHARRAGRPASVGSNSDVRRPTAPRRHDRTRP